MAKLSTSKIREMMAEWVGGATVEDMQQIYGDDHEYSLTKLVKDFSNPKNWKRSNKFRLSKDGGAGYFSPNPFTGLPFPIDVMGEFDEVLCKEMGVDPDRADKCILRVFHPSTEPLEYDFRMEVVTTPEDDRIIGWTVITD